MDHDKVRCTPKYKYDFIVKHSRDADIVCSVVRVFYEHKETGYNAAMLHASVILFALLCAHSFFFFFGDATMLHASVSMIDKLGTGAILRQHRRYHSPCIHCLCDDVLGTGDSE